jgi:hypothetical protein
MIEAPPRERTKPRTSERPAAGRAVSGVSSGGAYARFLELPPALVLAALWTAGTVILALCGLVLYMAGTALM